MGVRIVKTIQTQIWPIVMATPTLAILAATLVLLVKEAGGDTPTYPPTTQVPCPSPSPAPSPSPSFMQCGYKHFWANDHKLITYDRLITDHTSGEYLGNFDVEAGTFTAGTPGLYSVDFSSAVPYNTLNDYIEVYLWLNGVEVPESKFWSRPGYNTPGWVLDGGSARMTVELKEGDTLQLYGDYEYNALNKFVFCVTVF